jgi:hypothetical protein
LTEVSAPLCSIHLAIERAKLSHRRNGGTRLAPRFQQCNYIIIVVNRRDELAHSSERIWCVCTLGVTDGLDAPTDVGVPLRRERRGNCGKNVDLGRELQGTGGVRRRQDPIDLCADSLAGEASCECGVALDCCCGHLIECKVKSGNESDRAKHTKCILTKSIGWIPNGSQYATFKVSDAAMRVNDGTICYRISALTRSTRESIGDGVDGEVASGEVSLNAR